MRHLFFLLCAEGRNPGDHVCLSRGDQSGGGDGYVTLLKENLFVGHNDMFLSVNFQFSV